MHHVMESPASRRTAKDLLSVQLEVNKTAKLRCVKRMSGQVTERLLQGEEAKLAVLKNELDSSGGALPGGTKVHPISLHCKRYFLF